MLEINFEAARRQMIEQQLRAWGILDPAVLDTYKAILRHHFVPERYHNLAYADTEIPIGEGQVMMAPKVEARLLQVLNIAKDETALEIGTGTGFIAACLSHLGANVTSVDIRASFLGPAQKKLAEYGFSQTLVKQADAHTLTNDGPRYDAIGVTGAIPIYDRSFERRLNVGGRLFLIVGAPPVMDVMRIIRINEDEWLREKLFETDFPYLDNVQIPRHFEL